jgi:6-phosphogluconolactonase/glucosamine-6-phosphate isomerase/deaminase
MNIERYASTLETQKATARHLNDLLTQYVDRPILFLVAGGSSMEVLEHVNPEYLSPDLTVTTTDDRFSAELDVNNFSILQSASFYNNLIEADAFCISTEPFEDETIEQYRARLEKNIREWRQDFPKGIIIALYGMGGDGHTGGMIPGLMSKEEFYAEFNDADRLVGTFDAIAYEATLKAGDIVRGADDAGGARAGATSSASSAYEFPQRISTTIPFMRDWVDHAAFYITGENKKPALDAVIAIGDDTLSTDVDFSVSPISIARFMKDVAIFTDIVA